MVEKTFTQIEKAKQFYDLHHSGKLLILPNIWDVLGAKLLQDVGYPAVATASASVAYSNGYNDGENISFADVLIILKKIAGCVNVPVTADVESGYAENDIDLEKNIRAIIETGIVGINIEDTDKKTKTLLPAEVQCEKIKRIKKVAEEMNVPLFINARTDCFVHDKIFDSPQSRLDETIKRGIAYKAAGADCFYPILFNNENEIRAIVQQVKMPVNVITIPGIPELKVLQEIGVARVSLGPSFLKYAIKAMKDLAIQLQNYDGLTAITGNDITSDYLKHLVSE
ncbi:MAG: isocitrate lyase/phosphoenolpyruvate mutase family protein [Parafilimonas sp.]